MEALTQKYNIGEDEVLSTIAIFSGININSASITLPNGRKSAIDFNGIITEGVLLSKEDNIKSS